MRLESAIARARRWLDEIVSGKAAGIEAIAAREGLNERSARRTLSLAFLAPDIVKAAVDGTLPRGLGVSRLIDMPVSWATQRRAAALPSPHEHNLHLWPAGAIARRRDRPITFHGLRPRLDPIRFECDVSRAPSPHF